MEQYYDVALWRYWPSHDLPYHALIPADTVNSALLAALQVMQDAGLKQVARAAVGLPGGGIQRWERDLTLYTERSTDVDEEEMEVMP